MACVHKSLEPVRTAIGLVCCEQRNAVIAPALVSGPGSYRHDLNVGHSQIK